MDETVKGGISAVEDRGLLDAVESNADNVLYKLAIPEVPRAPGSISRKIVVIFLASCPFGISGTAVILFLLLIVFGILGS